MRRAWRTIGESMRVVAGVKRDQCPRCAIGVGRCPLLAHADTHVPDGWFVVSDGADVSGVCRVLNEVVLDGSDELSKFEADHK